MRRLITTDYYIKTLWFTAWQAALSTLLTMTLALPSAYVFARYKFTGKSTIKAICTLPFVLPTVVVANAFMALLGTNGLLNNILMSTFSLDTAPIQLNHTIWMILLAHVFYNYSVAFRIISNFWGILPDNLTQAAQVLGASPRRAFFEITLPLLRPAIAAASMLVFIFCFTSFGVILILGGMQFATLEVEIYRQAVNIFNLPMAGALSLIQIIFTFALMWVYTRLQANMTIHLKRQAQSTFQRPVKSRVDKLLVGGTLTLMFVLLASPLLALIIRSFTTTQGIALTYYRELFINRHGSLFFIPPIEAVYNSTSYALVTVVMAVFLGLICSHMLTNTDSILSRWLDPLFMLPLATSAVTLGFGFIITMNKPPLSLRSSWILVPIAHTLVGLPFVIRSLLPAMRSINPKLREAAALLGATPIRIWREIDWPLIQQAVLVGAVFAFTVSMGEFGATIFLARPHTPTLPVAIYRFLARPGAMNYGQALAMSTLLMLVCATGFVLIERFRVGDEGEF
ncbi:MAG: hypothetical protein B6242_12050 [Anaerolineaceae bacterium 4572_78]|nr:MAG: hypothetical protein B6242_12050 [Anaerolineaceae bacterium 4572_78]